MGIIHSLSDIDWFEWNGVKCTNYGMHVLQQPSFIRPAERAEYVEIPGKAGSLTLLQGDDVYDDISLACTCVIDDPQGDVLAGSGRNLLQNNYISSKLRSDSTAELEPISAWAENFVNSAEFAKIFEAGVQYTFSFDYEITAVHEDKTYSSGEYVLGFLLYSPSNPTGLPNTDLRTWRKTGVGTKGHVSKSFVLKEIISDAKILMYTNRYTDGLWDTVKFSNIKIERGNKETDWTPAPEDLPVVEASRIASICSWLRGYGKVKFAVNDLGYYEARIENQISFDKIVAGNPHRSFQVQFRCKPFWRLDSGDKALTATSSPYTLTNLGNVPSLPLLKVYSGSTDVTNATIMIGSSTMIINSLEKNSYIMIDCEAKKAYRGSRGSASDPLTLLGTRVTGEWMKIPTGTSYLSYTGGISKIEITPRWRCLG